MAVPKKKSTPSRRGMRNAHRALKPIQLMECSNCGSAKLSHHICSKCGFYNNKLVISKVHASTGKEAENHVAE